MSNDCFPAPAHVLTYLHPGWFEDLTPAEQIAAAHVPELWAPHAAPAETQHAEDLELAAHAVEAAGDAALGHSDRTARVAVALRAVERVQRSLALSALAMGAQP